MGGACRGRTAGARRDDFGRAGAQWPRAPASGRPDRPPGRPTGRGRAWAGGKPRPGEIWWAQVPYEDGPGSKDRPCLVLSVRGSTVVVAKITSKHHEERPG
ncbi:type II toxin-antitoxin system PemK/MazF family toxin [Streptomyces sp. M10(2022)]